MPQPIVLCSLGYVCNNLIEMFAIGVGYENLPESTRSAYDIHYPTHTAGIKFVENIVEQQQGFHAKSLAQQFILGKTESCGKCLCLSLRSSAAQRHCIACKYDIVAVRTR